MFNDINNVLNLMQPSDRVLDVGGGATPFPRADAVLDILPYEAYLQALEPGAAPRISRDGWFTGDICHPSSWAGLAEKSYDFAICSHTLEDVRDPLFVCSQLQRVAKAGYIETPAKFRECAKADPAHIVAGWEHHRWIVEVVDDTIFFTMKNPLIHHFDFAGNAHRDRVFDYFLNFIGVHWIESFDYAERTQKGSPIETEELHRFYEQFDYTQPLSATRPPVFFTIDKKPFLGMTLRHTGDFRLPIEHTLTHEQIRDRYTNRLAGESRSADDHVRLSLPIRVREFFRSLKPRR